MHNCLSAPAEVSTWTRFCELQMPTEIALFLGKLKIEKEFQIIIKVSRVGCGGGGVSTPKLFKQETSRKEKSLNFKIIRNN